MARFGLTSISRHLSGNAFLLILPLLLPAQELVLPPGPAVPVGELLPDAASIAAADFNQDGRMDLLIGVATGVVLLEAAGEGPYRPGRQVMSGCWVASLIAADFNRDGQPDIAAFCPNSQQVLILLGTGAGEFRETASLAVSADRAYGMAAADLDQDGLSDLAIGTFNGVALFRGLGDGSFAPTAQLRTGTPSLAVASGDFNGDGLADLAAAGYGSTTVSVFLGTGRGAFGSPLRLVPPPGRNVEDLDIADLNNDGKADLAAAYQEGLVVWLSAGDGTFQAGTLTRESNVPISILIADLNNDGNKDVLLGTHSGAKIATFTGKGDGTFVRASSIPAPGDVYAVVVADLNGDEVPDVAAASYSSDSALTAFGWGDGTFAPPAYFGFARSSFLRAADFDGSGAADLAVFVGPRRSAYFLRRGSEPQSTAPWSDYPVEAQFSDFNRDGRADLLVVTTQELTGRQNEGHTAKILYLAGLGAGAFEPPVEVAAPAYPLSRDTGIPRLLIGDFTGDGTPGFVFQNNATNRLQVFRGLGNGTFEPVAESSSPATSALIAADFDKDGIQDVAAVAGQSWSEPGTLSIWFGGKGGAFRESRTAPTCVLPRFLAAGDFNGDAGPDLTVICASPDEVVIALLLNDGAGAFQTTTTVKLNANMYRLMAVAAADMDGDGVDDLVTSLRLNAAWGGASILRGMRDGGFQPPLALPLPAEPLAVLALQWDGDNKADLAVLSGTDATVRLLCSQPPQSPAGKEVRR